MTAPIIFHLERVVFIPIPFLVMSAMKLTVVPLDCTSMDYSQLDLVAMTHAGILGQVLPVHCFHFFHSHCVQWRRQRSTIARSFKGQINVEPGQSLTPQFNGNVQISGVQVYRRRAGEVAPAGLTFFNENSRIREFTILHDMTDNITEFGRHFITSFSFNDTAIETK